MTTASSNDNNPDGNEEKARPTPRYFAQDGFDTQWQQQEEWKENKNQDDDDDAHIINGSLIGSYEARFHASQIDMSFFSVRLGLKEEDNRMIANWDDIPYINCKKLNKRSFKPTKEQLW